MTRLPRLRASPTGSGASVLHHDGKRCFYWRPVGSRSSASNGEPDHLRRRPPRPAHAGTAAPVVVDHTLLRPAPGVDPEPALHASFEVLDGNTPGELRAQSMRAALLQRLDESPQRSCWSSALLSRWAVHGRCRPPRSASWPMPTSLMRGNQTVLPQADADPPKPASVELCVRVEHEPARNRDHACGRWQLRALPDRSGRSMTPVSAAPCAVQVAHVLECEGLRRRPRPSGEL